MMKTKSLYLIATFIFIIVIGMAMINQTRRAGRATYSEKTLEDVMDVVILDTFNFEEQSIHDRIKVLNMKLMKMGVEGRVRVNSNIAGRFNKLLLPDLEVKNATLRMALNYSLDSTKLNYSKIGKDIIISEIGADSHQTGPGDERVPKPRDPFAD